MMRTDKGGVSRDMVLTADHHASMPCLTYPWHSVCAGKALNCMLWCSHRCSQRLMLCLTVLLQVLAILNDVITGAGSITGQH